MNQVSHHMPNSLVEAGAAIRETISSSGFIPPENIYLDGSIRRFDGENSRGKKKNCWYVGHYLPIPIVIFGDWKSGYRSKYVHSSKALSRIETTQLFAQLREHRTRRERLKRDEYLKAATKAKNEWRQSAPAQNHNYLETKQIPAYRLRVNKNDSLLIPVTDGNQIQSLQYIKCDGTKKFLQGGKVKGHYYPVGMTDNPDQILICEGIATGLTLYKEFHLPIIVTFSASNLVPVANLIWRNYPDSRILICGDNDHATEGNPGKSKAIEAATLCGCEWVVPDFTGLNSGPNDTDFNDLKRLKETFHE